jgi:hypothetical protein
MSECRVHISVGRNVQGLDVEVRVITRAVLHGDANLAAVRQARCRGRKCIDIYHSHGYVGIF